MHLTRILRRLTAASVAVGMLLLGGPVAPVARAAGGPDLVAGRPVAASSANGQYVARNVNDGDRSTYWESANNAFPQWIQGDLGAAVPVSRLALGLPAGWERRTQTLKVQGSTDGNAFTDLLPSAAYTFDPRSGNTATVDLPTVTTRFLRLLVTANSGWPAAQLASFEVYGPTTGDTRAPSAPTGLAYAQAGP
ncbi:discoidin domain-containing protein, partial [Kitasatospora purpeofusca]|uniref:discoidin domain-containing protein n=1 Tax=Kitasatospora purpeofusca TaxID=67352 RepID=UPI00365DB4B9